RLRLSTGRCQSAGFSGCRAQLPRFTAGLSPGALRLHAVAGAVAAGGRDKESAMNLRFTTRHGLFAAAASLMLFLVAGCGHKEPSAYENTAKTASPGLFTVPPEQMQHIQLFTVAPTEMKRTLRLTGAVAYNAFETTPVISSVGGPVARIVVAPGVHVNRGQPMLYVSSPDFAQLRATYLKARDAFSLADKNFA